MIKEVLNVEEERSYEQLLSENYSLKRQLVHRNKDIKALKSGYSSLLAKYKKLIENKKPKYNNGRRNK